MAFPIGAAFAGASALSGLFGSNSKKKKAKKQQAEADRLIARILPVQQQEFDYRFNLTDSLNRAMLQLEADRYNTTNAVDTNARGGMGEESIARFNEQVGAVDDQVAANRGSANELLDAISAAMAKARTVTSTERAKQHDMQGGADAAATALPSSIGAPADAAQRAIAAGKRMAAATAAIGGPETGGFAPQTHGRVMEEFARRGTEANTDALTQAGADAQVGAYGDAKVAADNTIMNFNNVIDAMRAKATASRAALPAELAAPAAAASGALTRFDGSTGLSKLIAGRTIENSDAYRGGRIVSNSEWGESNKQSLAEYFARMNSAYATGGGGQVGASERYANLFSNLMRDQAARTLGQPVSSGWDDLSGVLGAFSGINFGGFGSGGGK